jgi:hypothetical protein
MLFQKGVVRTKLHIHVFIDNLTTSWNTFDDSIKYWEKKIKYHTVGTIPKIKYQYCRKMIIKCVLDACAQEKLEAK